MKKLISLLLLATCLTAFAQSNTNIVGELVIKTWPTNALSIAEIKIRPGPMAFNKATGLPVIRLNVEYWGDDVDAGVTNRIFLRTDFVTLTPNQQAAWFGAQDGAVWIKTAVLNKAKTTEKP